MKQLTLLLTAIFCVLSTVASGADIDYTSMRLKFAAQAGYNPYVLQGIEKAKIEEAMEAWKAGKAADAFKGFYELLDVIPVSIETHRRLADGYEHLIGQTTNTQYKGELEKRSKYHRGTAEGLIKSITASGDGKSGKTAMKVISIPEEYMTLWYLDLSPEKVELDESGMFDVFSVKDRGGRSEKIFFDISILKNLSVKK